MVAIAVVLAIVAILTAIVGVGQADSLSLPHAASRLQGGERLSVGDRLTSPNGQVRLIMQSDGNLVLYSDDNRALWNSRTAGNLGATATLQTDGNFVVYSAKSAPLWANYVFPGAGARLELQDDGNLVEYPVKGGYAWASGTWQPPRISGDVLLPGSTLYSGQSIVSKSGRYRLLMQSDGNAVIYAGPRAVWSTGTWGWAGARLAMQDDGNLVVYDAQNRPRFATMTHGYARAVMQDDGNLVVYNAGANAAFWTGVDVGTSKAPPTAVEGLTAVAYPTSTELRWALPADGSATSAVVRRATGATAPASPTAGTSVVVNGAAATDSAVAIGTRYTYAVFSLSPAGVAGPARTSSVVTPATPPAAPSAPTALTLAVSDQSVVLSWTPPNGAYTGIEVRRTWGYWDESSSELIATLAFGATTFTDPRSPGRAWASYSISALNSGVTSAPVTATTQFPAVITGRVTDMAGAPLAGVRVYAFIEASGRYPRGDGTTGADGRYRLEVTDDVDVTVCFGAWGATGGASATGYSSQCFSGTAQHYFYDDIAGTPVHASRGTVVDGINAVLQPGAVISGEVRDALGRPVVGMLVNVTHGHEDNYDMPRTDSQGRYRIIGVDAGAVEVCFFGLSFAPTSPVGGLPFADQCSGLAASGFGPDGSIAATLGTTTTVNRTLLTAGTYSGTITDAVTGGPLAGVTVYATGRLGVEPARVRTDASGHYEIVGANPGAWQICTDPGPPSNGKAYIAQCFSDAGGNVVGVPVALGQRVVVDIALTRRPLVTGLVKDTAGAPIAGVTVTTREGGPTGSWDGTATTGADGRYVIAAYPGRRLVVCAFAPGLVGPAAPAGYQPGCRIDAEGVVIVTVIGSADVTADVVLIGGGGFDTEVRTSTGAIIPADVSVERLDPSPQYVGTGSSMRSLLPGTYKVCARPSAFAALQPFGYDTPCATVAVAVGVSSVQLTMHANGQLNGRLVDSSGAMVAGGTARVMLTGSPETLREYYSSTFSFTGAPGAYLVCGSGTVAGVPVNSCGTDFSGATTVVVPEGGAVAVDVVLGS